MALKELAKLFVRITAPRQQLKADLDGAKQDVEGFAASTEKSTRSVNTAIGDTGENIKDATKGVRGFVGAITGVVGTFTRVLGIVGLITGAIGGLIALVSSLASKSEEVAAAEQKAAEWAERRRKSLNELEGRAQGKKEPDADQRETQAIKDAIVARSQSIADQDALVRKYTKAVEILKDELDRPSLEGDEDRAANALRANKQALEVASETLKKLQDETKRDEDVIKRRDSATETIAQSKTDEEAHKKRLKYIEVEESHRLRLQIEAMQQIQAMQQAASQFNNSFAYDIRRLVSSVEQIKGRLN